MGMHDIQPEISVVMSVYNGQEYLRLAMDSILGQTFGEFEFIIVDDGSTDASMDIIRSYGDARIRVIRQQNTGIAGALNNGVNAARGKYIARMDADDISHPDRLRLQYEYMEKNHSVDIIGTQAYMINEEGDVIGKKTKPVSSYVIAKAIEYACPIIHPTYLARKEVYKELGGYREKFPPAEDYDFLLRAIDAGKKLENLDKHLLYYRLSLVDERPVRARCQMIKTRLVIRLHKNRLRNEKEDEEILRRVSSMALKGVSARFVVAYRLRNAFILRAKNAKRAGRSMAMIAVMIVSLADYELFCSSLRGARYKRACVEI